MSLWYNGLSFIFDHFKKNIGWFFIYPKYLSHFVFSSGAPSGGWQAWNQGLFLASLNPTPVYRTGHSGFLLSDGEIPHAQGHQAKKQAYRLTASLLWKPSSSAPQWQRPTSQGLSRQRPWGGLVPRQWQRTNQEQMQCPLGCCHLWREVEMYVVTGLLGSVE